MSRKATEKRQTNETEIEISFTVDGEGKADVSTGIPFMDHMLTLFARHGFFDLTVKASGDLDIDAHHTMEDLGIVLGTVIRKALGDKKGIRRYGFFILPMDETLARAVVDFSGRPCLVWKGMDKLGFKVLKEEKIQDDACRFRFSLAREFFQGFTSEARCNLHLELLYGEEPHHVVEALFKAFAKATDFACQKDPRIGVNIPSTKGRLSG